MLISFVVTEICSTQNLSMKNKQRTITLKLVRGGLWFLCSTRPLNEIYTPLKFHVQICNSLWAIASTRLWRPDGRTAGRTTPNLYSSKKVKDHYCVAVFWKKFTYWFCEHWRTMFTDVANLFPSIRLETCDLKTVASRNMIGCVVSHYWLGWGLLW